MDRRGLGALTTLGLTLAAVGFAHGDALSPLTAGRWVGVGDPAVVLTRQPAECLRMPADPEAAWSVEVGRAAFRSPTLLGGQAAKAGVTCETCHRNGRGNPNFAFPGISGGPGTADVTSAVFSSHRDDGLTNPKPIPDLAAPGQKVSRAAGSGELQTFLHGLVAEEFDGHPPPPGVMTGLADYVRAISPSACKAPAITSVTARGAAEDVRRAVRAARGALDRKDMATAIVLIEAARGMLGQIDERYVADALKAQRAMVRTASLDLAAAAATVRSGGDASAALDLWLGRSAVWKAALEKARARSYYDRRTLAAAMRS